MYMFKSVRIHTHMHTHAFFLSLSLKAGKGQEKRENESLWIKQYQLTKAEGMTEAENHYFTTFKVLYYTVSGKDCQ